MVFILCSLWYILSLESTMRVEVIYGLRRVFAATQ